MKKRTRALDVGCPVVHLYTARLIAASGSVAEVLTRPGYRRSAEGAE